MNNITKLFERIDTLLKLDKPIVIAIDGMSCSGKTTLAGKIADKYDCNLIHTDHFFLPPFLRTQERYAMPGGNVHYERLESEVIQGLISKKPFKYRIFDCKKTDFSNTVTLCPKKLTVIEGSYSLHPYLTDIYDLKVFCETSQQTQLERLSERNPDKVNDFVSKWIPLEKKYFENCKTKQKTDIILTT